MALFLVAKEARGESDCVHSSSDEAKATEFDTKFFIAPASINPRLYFSNTIEYNRMRHRS